jgi:mitochondrial fission protein ELM1
MNAILSEFFGIKITTKEEAIHEVNRMNNVLHTSHLSFIQEKTIHHFIRKVKERFKIRDEELMEEKYRKLMAGYSGMGESIIMKELVNRWDYNKNPDEDKLIFRFIDECLEGEVKNIYTPDLREALHTANKLLFEISKQFAEKIRVQARIKSLMTFEFREVLKPLEDRRLNCLVEMYSNLPLEGKTILYKKIVEFITAAFTHGNVKKLGNELLEYIDYKPPEKEPDSNYDIELEDFFIQNTYEIIDKITQPEVRGFVKEITEALIELVGNEHPSKQKIHHRLNAASKRLSNTKAFIGALIGQDQKIYDYLTQMCRTVPSMTKNEFVLQAIDALLYVVKQSPHKAKIIMEKLMHEVSRTEFDGM